MIPLLRRPADARVVNVSSGAGQLDDMNGGLDRLPNVEDRDERDHAGVLAAEEAGIRSNSICPGWVRTDMGGSSAPKSVEEGADTAYGKLATDPEIGSGGFYSDRAPIPW